MANRNTPPYRRRNGGFTLIEMLLVVAIIAVLVAVSIPAIGNSLERARQAADVANERAAKAAVAIKWASGEFGPEDSGKGGTKDWCVYEYEAATGNVFKKTGDDSECSTAGYGKCEECKGGRIVAWVCPECGQIFTFWKTGKVNGKDVPNPPHANSTEKGNWYTTHNGVVSGDVVNLKGTSDHFNAHQKSHKS